MKKNPKIINIILEAFESLNLKITPWRRSIFIRNFIKNLQISGWCLSAEDLIKKDYRFLFDSTDKILYDQIFSAYYWSVQKYNIPLTDIENSLNHSFHKYKIIL